MAYSALRVETTTQHPKRVIGETRRIPGDMPAGPWVGQGSFFLTAIDVDSARTWHSQEVQRLGSS